VIVAPRQPGRGGKSERRSGPAGFTLVEVVVAVGLFVLGAMGVFGLASAALRLNAFSLRTTEATTLAENTLEDLFARSAADVRPGTNMASPYTIVWTVADTGPAGARTLRVSVRWSDAGGNTRQVGLNGIRVD
jgi:Tfp pilus assembly protein PilV